MIGMLWFLFGILATIGTEFAALMGAANAAQANLGAARTSIAQSFAALGAQLDQIVAGFRLPF